ncbi:MULTISPECIES: CsgG/HfaB family protein [Acinetobacter]|jgi:curli biogenesis system outer membrane secretion channel CsgG|uniref:CsgG/HfaB family protein n=1 Tax=Acinetobacter TaxID=469 RepID=UPI000CDD33F2|nr:MULTISPECIES: CsgG/HfaB family protein [Acinetobacter]MCU4521292.1 HfaB protein [Acinetobacter schindleri]POU19243.1 HfaB protein [Acinetobacter sp. ACNIH3]POV75658.1 HfaB protein [Acinetobacter sp. ACNIH4]WQI99848.1 CsgG/HfaB family protein [Acinetobacter schindleri]
MLNFPYGRSLSSAGIILIFTQSLTGCTGLASSNSKPVELVQGPPITDIFTPFDMALSCLKGQLRNDISFSVGAILDQTGKDVVTNGGSGKMVTQGAGDMVQSALFQSGVSVMNRRDPRIIESEAKWGIRDPRQIQASDYYVTGSINSLDFIPGGGLDMQIAGVGPNYSQTRIMVGLDLSLTDTRSSKVVANVSLQKQIAAQDYGISAGRFTGRTLLNIQIGKGEREATNFALRQMLNLATFELLSQVVPPPVFEKCRAEIPPEFGRLNLTRSSVALHKYKKNQQQNNLDSSIPVQELTSDDIQQSQEKNKSTNTPSKDTKAPKNKESEVIQNPDPEPEISKQDLIKYISKKHSPDSSDKMLEEKEKQEKSSKEKDEEKTSMLWDANPEVVENYWSSTLRD